METFLLLKHGLLHISLIWSSITLRENDQSEAIIENIRICFDVLFLFENHYEESRLAFEGKFIEVSRASMTSTRLS